MRVNTPWFGPLDIPDDTILTFSAGIYGFPELRDCCLLPHHAGSPFRWLQCLNDPGVAFLTTEPHAFFPDYEIDLADGQAADIGLADAEEAAVITFVTICRESGAVTTNLAAPIIINTRTRQARQIVLDDDRYPTRHQIMLDRGADDVSADQKSG